MNSFMNLAIAEAEKGLATGDGGPFGAVIVRAGKILARAHNEVLKNNDPTCHAEIQAIRAASQKLKCFNLSDCEIYSNCEPCPMCLAAIYWARIPKLYFGATRADAAKIGFADKIIYDAIGGKAACERVEKIQVAREKCLQPFKKWVKMENVTQY
ncbi:nucleoside deaminase [Patescibacteria group bacterium]|nr:nucleoside deaminase [Patescibacteria group bacterium]